MDTISLFTIRTAPHCAGSWLYVDDGGPLGDIADLMRDLSEMGRIAREPVEVQMLAELEGQERQNCPKQGPASGQERHVSFLHQPGGVPAQ